MLALVVPYSSGVQQPVRATAVLSRRLHTRRAAPAGREQARASSLHLDAQRRPTITEQHHRAVIARALDCRNEPVFRSRRRRCAAPLARRQRRALPCEARPPHAGPLSAHSHRPDWPVRRARSRYVLQCPARGPTRRVAAPLAGDHLARTTAGRDLAQALRACPEIGPGPSSAASGHRQQQPMNLKGREARGRRRGRTGLAGETGQDEMGTRGVAPRIWRTAPRLACGAPSVTHEKPQGLGLWAIYRHRDRAGWHARRVVGRTVIAR